MRACVIAPLLALSCAACVGTSPRPDGGTPPTAEKLGAGATAKIPAPVQQALALRQPQATPPAETYSVVVNNVKVQELLFALARDAKLNVDIHPGIAGSVTLNAIDQTLPQLLSRIAKQADLRWELDGPNLAVMPDTPFLRTYRVDYVNMTRDTSGSVTVVTQIASTGSGTGVTGAGGGVGSSSNNSLTRIENKAQNRFWETLEKNIKDLLRETDKVLPQGSSETVEERIDERSSTGTSSLPLVKGGKHGGSTPDPIAASPIPVELQQSGKVVTRHSTFREAAAVIVNAETGIVSVRASGRQHEKIQEFLDQVMASAQRQVMIEATIAEVTLSDNYQQGVEWSRLGLNGLGLKFAQQAIGGIAAPASSLMEIGYARPDSALGNIAATVRLLDAFGSVKVLSSPKLSVLNNQTAVLKVVDNLVYFTVKADTTANTSTTTTTYTTHLYSVPVGLVVNVTPQIGAHDTVLLNVRPSISRQYASVTDPNPDLQRLGVKNEIPVIRTREMESVIRVQNGNIAVMGGLMEDSAQNTDHAVPGIARIPILGNLFQNRDDTRKKTELVIFLRPTVIKDGSHTSDYGEAGSHLSYRNDFDASRTAPRSWSLGFGSASR